MVIGCNFYEKWGIVNEKDATTKNVSLQEVMRVFKQKRGRNDLFLICAPPIDRSCSRKWLGFINFPKDIRHLMNISYRKNTIGENLQFVTTFHQNRSRDFQNSNGHLGALLLYHRPLESRLQSIRFGPCKSLNKLRPDLLTKRANVPN